MPPVIDFVLRSVAGRELNACCCLLSGAKIGCLQMLLKMLLQKVGVLSFFGKPPG